MKKQKLVSTFALILSMLLVGNTAFAIETEYQEESRTEESSTEEETTTEEESSTEDETATEESSTEEETTTERTTEKETDTKEDTSEKEIETKEMYRLYNPNNGEHFYTADINEKNHLVNAGWKYEGIGWYSDTKNTVPVYRLYNPNAVTGTHHYTLNYLEVENLQSLGWKYEGIAWYSSDDIFVDSGNNGEKKEYTEIGNVNENNGTFDVTVYLARSQSQISIVYVPVWTKSDQSDIYWYVAEKQSNGIYKVTVDVTNHQWNSGKYYVHVYVRDLFGNMNFISEQSVKMQLGRKIVVEKTSECSASVKIYGLADDVSMVRFPAWSVINDQDDIVWYMGTKNADGSWGTEIHSMYHKDIGEYACHIYATTNGKEVYVDKTVCTIENKLKNTWVWINGYKRYLNSEGEIDTDVSRLVKGPYFIKVYKWSNYVIVYAKDEYGNFTIPVKAMIASGGNNTPTGTYNTVYKWRWLDLVGGTKAQWCTQIIGNYLFHSVPYRTEDPTTLYTETKYNLLGTTQSLGCIRLQAGDAKWIYDNCASGTKVTITANETEGPIAKPEFTPIPSWHTWDPTDPTTQYLCKRHGCH